MDFDAVFGLMWVIFLLAGIAILIIWLVVMNRALDQVSHDIRKMEPGAVWLCIIPVFGLVLQFMITSAVANGIAGEFAVRNLFPKEAKPGMGVGSTGCLLVCCCVIPYAGVGIAIIGLVFMIIHLSKISEYNKALEASGRWEVRYNERMGALRQQQQTSWMSTQQNFQQPLPFQPPVQPKRSTFIPDTKEKPKNPFE